MKYVGVDLVEVKRISQLIKNNRFINRVFTQSEINYCQSKKNASQHYAVRFAAKEAVWKALNSQDIKNKRLTHKDIGIRNSADGSPRVALSNKFKSLKFTTAYTVLNS